MNESQIVQAIATLQKQMGEMSGSRQQALGDWTQVSENFTWVSTNVIGINNPSVDVRLIFSIGDRIRVKQPTYDGFRYATVVGLSDTQLTLTYTSWGVPVLIPTDGYIENQPFDELWVSKNAGALGHPVEKIMSPDQTSTPANVAFETIDVYDSAAQDPTISSTPGILSNVINGSLVGPVANVSGIFVLTGASTPNTAWHVKMPFGFAADPADSAGLRFGTKYRGFAQVPGGTIVVATISANPPGTGSNKGVYLSIPTSATNGTYSFSVSYSLKTIY